MPGRQLSRGAPCAVQVAAEMCLPGQLRDRPCAEGGAAQAKGPGPRRKLQMQNPQIQRANRETLKELKNKQDDAPNTLPPSICLLRPQRLALWEASYSLVE